MVNVNINIMAEANTNIKASVPRTCHRLCKSYADKACCASTAELLHKHERMCLIQFEALLEHRMVIAAS